MPSPPARGRPPARPEDGRPASPALSFSGVHLQGGASAGCAVLDLVLSPGDSALVLHPDPEVLREVISLAMCWSRPLAGSVLWEEGRAPSDDGVMARLRFNRGVGLVHAGLALVPGRTVVEHLVLFYRYHLTEPRRTLAARAIRLVRSMGLCAADRQDLRKVHSEWLEERTLRIGLYAVALAKSPWLFVLESPGAFLGKDFPPLWERIGSERRERGAAVLVLDRSEEGYGEGAFRSVARLGGPAS